MQRTRRGVDRVGQVVELDVDRRPFRLVRQRLHLDPGRYPGDRPVFGHAEHARPARLHQRRRVLVPVNVLVRGPADRVVDHAGERHGAVDPVHLGSGRGRFAVGRRPFDHRLRGPAVPRGANARNRCRRERRAKGERVNEIEKCARRRKCSSDREMFTREKERENVTKKFARKG